MGFEKPNEAKQNKNNIQTPKSIILTRMSSISESNGVVITSLSGNELAASSLPVSTSPSRMSLDWDIRADVFSK